MWTAGENRAVHEVRISGKCISKRLIDDDQIHIGGHMKYKKGLMTAKHISLVT